MGLMHLNILWYFHVKAHHQVKYAVFRKLSSIQEFQSIYMNCVKIGGNILGVYNYLYLIQRVRYQLPKDIK